MLRPSHFEGVHNMEDAQLSPAPRHAWSNCQLSSAYPRRLRPTGEVVDVNVFATDSSWNTNGNAPWWHGPNNDSVCANDGAISDGDIAQHFSPGRDENVVFNLRYFGNFVSPPDGYTLCHKHIPANFCLGVDDHTHTPVANLKSLTDLCAIRKIAME